jgi:hypothetical protein
MAENLRGLRKSHGAHGAPYESICAFCAVPVPSHFLRTSFAVQSPIPSLFTLRPLHCNISKFARLAQIFPESKTLGFGYSSRQDAKAPSSEE